MDVQDYQTMFYAIDATLKLKNIKGSAPFSRMQEYLKYDDSNIKNSDVYIQGPLFGYKGIMPQSVFKYLIPITPFKNNVLFSPVGAGEYFSVVKEEREFSFSKPNVVYNNNPNNNNPNNTDPYENLYSQIKKFQNSNEPNDVTNLYETLLNSKSKITNNQYQILLNEFNKIPQNEPVQIATIPIKVINRDNGILVYQENYATSNSNRSYQSVFDEFDFLTINTFKNISENEYIDILKSMNSLLSEENDIETNPLISTYGDSEFLKYIDPNSTLYSLVSKTDFNLRASTKRRVFSLLVEKINESTS